jgi:anti-sigma factor RsiW
MDHNDAIRLQAAEKYFLGELDATLRDQYEEHYFDCAECALDLRAAAAFVDTSRQVFREDSKTVANSVKEAACVAQRTPSRPSWLQQLRWALVGVPVFATAVLAVLFTYQSTVTIPSLKSAATPAVASTYDHVLRLGASGTRRGADTPANDVPFQIGAKDAFSVTFDFTPSIQSSAYVAQLRNASGRLLLQLAVPGDQAFNEFSLPVPAGVISASGQYRVVLLGADPASGQPLSGDPVQNFAITVAIHQ